MVRIFSRRIFRQEIAHFAYRTFLPMKNKSWFVMDEMYTTLTMGKFNFSQRSKYYKSTSNIVKIAMKKYFLKT